jgi:hypothetical protein
MSNPEQDPTLALWFSPQAIKDHFDGDVSLCAEWIRNEATQDELVAIGNRCLDSDRLYEVFHAEVEMQAWDAYTKAQEAVKVSVTPETNVNLFWRDSYGHCYDCGLPAAFILSSEYTYQVNRSERVEYRDTDKRCAICAANAAADGEYIQRIEDLPEGSQEQEA